MFFMLIEFYLTPTPDQLYIYLFLIQYMYKLCSGRFEELFGMMQI